MKILVVEDERSLREIIVKSLETEKYVVESAADYGTALEKSSLYDYDCILLDIMLPDGSGLDLLQQLKSQGKSEGVIIISARDSVDDRVKGLELGADDYLPKPFHLSELNARVRSVIRRKMGNGSNDIHFGNIILSLDSRTVSVAGKMVELSRKEYDILHYFIDRRGHLIAKEVLAEAVWGDNIDQSDNFDFIYAHLKNLRKKLNEAGSNIEIKTIYGFGYKMSEEL